MEDPAKHSPTQLKFSGGQACTHSLSMTHGFEARHALYSDAQAPPGVCLEHSSQTLHDFIELLQSPTMVDPDDMEDPPAPPLPPFVVSNSRHAGKITAASSNVMVATTRLRIIPPSGSLSGPSPAKASRHDRRFATGRIPTDVYRVENDVCDAKDDKRSCVSVYRWPWRLSSSHTSRFHPLLR
jgi:hypothetical protein